MVSQMKAAKNHVNAVGAVYHTEQSTQRGKKPGNVLEFTREALVEDVLMRG